MPAPEDGFFQMIDVSDSAAFALRAAAEGRSGIYNLTGRDMPFSALFDAMIAVSGAEAELVWVAGEKLQAAGIQPWTELPLIVPPSPAARYLFQIDTEKAHRDGLSCRPIAETLGDLLRWDRAERARALKCGISREQERTLLA